MASMHHRIIASAEVAVYREPIWRPRPDGGGARERRLGGCLSLSINVPPVVVSLINIATSVRLSLGSLRVDNLKLFKNLNFTSRARPSRIYISFADSRRVSRILSLIIDSPAAISSAEMIVKFRERRAMHLNRLPIRSTRAHARRDSSFNVSVR